MTGEPAPGAADGEPTQPTQPAQPAPPAGMRGTPGVVLHLIKDQRIAFLLVGGLNTAIGAAFFILFLSLFSVSYIVVLIMSHICAVLFAFVFYRHLVFRVRGHVFRDLWRFELVNLTSLLVNLLLLPIAVEGVGLSPLVGQLAVTSLTVFISFFGHRDFSFRRSSPTDGHPARRPSALRR